MPSTLEAVFAPPVLFDVVIDGKSVEVRFARIEFPQWAEWRARFRKEVRDYWRNELKESNAPERAIAELPIEKSSPEKLPLPLAELAQRITSDESYTFDLLVDQAVIGGSDEDDARKIVSAIPPMDRGKIAVALTNEELKQEPNVPLLIPLSRNPPADLEAAIEATTKQLATLTAMRPTTEKTGSSGSPGSAPSSPSSTLAA